MINKLRIGGTSLPKVTPSFASLTAEADKRLFFSVCMYVSMYVCMYVCMYVRMYVVPPRAPEVAVHSAQWDGGYSLFLLLIPPQAKPVHSWWLVPLCGLGFLWHSDCSPLPRIHSDTFYSSLKTVLFSRTRVGSASE